MQFKLRTIFLLFVLSACTWNCLAQTGKNKETVNQNDTGDIDRLRREFANPANDYRALPLGLSAKDDAAGYVERLVRGRWGGGQISYPAGAAGYLHDTTGWNLFSNVLQGCRENNLKVWIYDEAGYPSGRAGGQVLAGHPEFEAQGLYYASRDVQIRDRKGAQGREINWRIPEGTPFFVAMYALDREGHITGEPVELTGSVQNGLVSVSPAPGSWRLMAFVRNRLFAGTHAVLTGGPYINILDPEAVRRFIRITHESYYARYGADFGSMIRAIFNDEVSVMNGFLTDDTQPFPAVAWYDGLPGIFRERNGYDIRDCLPALFDDEGPGTARKRCDFYSLISHQIGDAFFKQIREWCAAHHIVSTGHLLWEESLVYQANFYGSVFPSYKELDWPGIDVLSCQYGCTSGSHTEGGPVTPKLASSATHIWDKERTMSESFWSVTNKTPIEEVIAHYNWQAVLGINALTTLTIQKSYSDQDLERLNDCAGRLNYLLTKGQFRADVAILYPIASVWAGFRPASRHVHNLGDNPLAREVDEAWRYVSSAVLGCQRDFDYLDEELIRSATVAGGKLHVGKNSYSVLVLPHVTTLSFATLKQIKEFTANGGTVISWQTLPMERADAGPDTEYQSLVEELWNNANGRVIHAMTEATLRRALRSSGTPDLVVTPATTGVYYQHRSLPGGDIYFVVNNSRTPVSSDFDFRARGKAELWNPLNGEITAANVRKTTAGSAMKLSLAAQSGLFVIFNRNE